LFDTLGRARIEVNQKAAHSGTVSTNIAFLQGSVSNSPEKKQYYFQDYFQAVITIAPMISRPSAKL
jgi:hypothetical protein